MLAIGRGLMGKPRLFCLDEPSLGLAPIVVELIGKVIKDINSKGVSVLFAEQNVNLAFSASSKGYAFQVGRVVLEEDTATMKNNEVIKKAFLGG